MKITDFIKAYRACPMCTEPLDCIMRIRLNYSIHYQMFSQLASGFDFRKVPSFSGGSGFSSGPNNEENLRMPTVIRVRDNFHPPYDDRVWLGPTKKNDYGEVSFSLECQCNDFLAYSTNFNMFDQVHIVETDRNKFISGDTTVLNDYVAAKTTIIYDGETYEKGLITLDKWPLGDKIKLEEKIEKLLVLL